MQENQWSRAALRIGSTVLACSDITAALQIQPTRCREKGEPISRRNPNSKKRLETVWTLESGLNTLEALEKHIEKIADFVESNAEALGVLAEQCTLTLFCGFSHTGEQGGFTLSSELLRKISAVPVEIVFDLYLPVSDDSSGDSSN